VTDKNPGPENFSPEKSEGQIRLPVSSKVAEPERGLKNFSAEIYLEANPSACLPSSVIDYVRQIKFGIIFRDLKGFCD